MSSKSSAAFLRKINSKPSRNGPPPTAEGPPASTFLLHRSSASSSLSSLPKYKFYPLSKPQNEKELDLVIKELNNQDIVTLTITSIKYLQRDSIPIAVSFLSRLLWNNEVRSNYV